MNEFRAQFFSGRPRQQILFGRKQPRGATADAGLQSVPVPRTETRTSDTREEDRHRLVDERITLVHKRKTHDVELINLSSGGAMVAGSFKPKLWDKVRLNLTEGTGVECKVQWVKDGRVGLSFAPETHLECSPQELRALLREVIGRSFPEMGIDVTMPVEEPEAPEPVTSKPENENRAAQRLPLVWKGTVHFDFTSTPVRIRNISTTGALIDCEVPLPEGAEPLLDIGEAGSVFATVSWRNGEQVGLSFKTPFDLAQLAHSKPEIAPLWREKGRTAYAPDDEQLSDAELRDLLESFLRR